MTQQFANGKRAFGFCDRCGFRTDLKKLAYQIVNQKPTGLKVCSICNDKDHPQLQLGKFPINDPVALYQPRPDINTGVGLFGWNPVGNPATFMTGNVGSVGVLEISPPPPNTIEYLLVAGGGGGAGGYGGGGGGGGVRLGNLSVTLGAQIIVVIGAGGVNSNGSNSSIADVIAIGGGVGGDLYQSGANGGSGGGGGFGEDGPGLPLSPPGGGGISGQGYSGGSGSPIVIGEEGIAYGGGGGGGGAGGSGQNAPPYTYVFDGGNGGPGLVSSIAGGAFSYGSGGGGSGDGMGGDGAGNGFINPPQDGVINRGGGGGAGYSGGQGGSGFVAIRYPFDFRLPISITGGGSVVTSGGFHIISFASSGSITF